MNRYKDAIEEAEDDKIEDDIFKDRPESSLCFAMERKIEGLFISPLFEIQYNCVKDRKICKNFAQSSRYSLLFDRDKRNKLCDIFYENKGKDYDFVLDRGGRDIIIWLRGGIIFSFSLDEIQNLLICCKGIKIKDSYLG